MSDARGRVATFTRRAYPLSVPAESLLNPSASVSTDLELQVLTEIAGVLSSTLELRQAFARIMQLVDERLGMHRGTLVLLDDSTGRLRTEIAYGLASEDIERNRFALGEGITGNVVATGRARV